MISKRLAKYLFFGTFLGVLLIPAIALAAEGEAAAVVSMGASPSV